MVVDAMWVGGGIPAFWGFGWELKETEAGRNHYSGERDEVTESHSRSVVEQGVELGLC